MSTVLPDNLESVLSRYSDAWLAHDVETVMSVHTVDTVFQLHDGTEEILGQQAVSDAFAFVVAVYPDLAATRLRVVVGAEHAVVESVMHATSNGAHIDIDSVDVFRFRDGLIARKDTYLNTAGLQA